MNSVLRSDYRIGRYYMRVFAQRRPGSLILMVLLIFLTGVSYCFKASAQSPGLTNKLDEPLMLEITDLDGPPAYAAINKSSQTILTVTAVRRSGYWRRP